VQPGVKDPISVAYPGCRLLLFQRSLGTRPILARLYRILFAFVKGKIGILWFANSKKGVTSSATP